jgi:hypothetical protein
MNSKIFRLNLDLSAAQHKQLKNKASALRITIKDLVLISLDNFINRKLNKITRKAIKQSERKKNLKHFDNLEELFHDIGI